MLNFNHLYYFHVTATEGSVKAAAERLGVTQPTVSEQLRMLERNLEVQLFDRTPTGIKLTQAGRDAYEHTMTMFRAGERLVETLGHAANPPTVALRVGVSAAMARAIATDFLMPVLTVERCRPSIRTGDFSDLLRELRTNELDLVMGETEPLEAARKGLDVDMVHRVTLVAIARPGIEPLPDWNNLNLLEFRPTSVYHWDVDNYLRDKDLHPSVMGELDDAFLMLEAVIRGGFVAFVPWSVAREALRSGTVRALATLPLTTAAVYAVHQSGAGMELVRTAIQRLIENARDQFEGSLS